MKRMPTPNPQRVNVFISYSRKDAKWLERLRVHLKPLERAYNIEIWDDGKIAAGADWKEEVAKALGAAKVGVLLVSAYFLASDFVASDELPRLLQAAEDEGLRILPILLSPCGFERSGLSRFQLVNNPPKPLTKMNWDRQEENFERLADILASSSERPPEAAAPPELETVAPPESKAGEAVGESQTSGASAETTTAPVRLVEDRPTPGLTGSESTTRESDESVTHVVTPPGPPPRRRRLRLWPTGRRVKLWSLVVILGLLALAAGYWQYRRLYPSNGVGERLTHKGRVIDAVSHDRVPHVNITYWDGSSVWTTSTDDDGIFYIGLPPTAGALHIKAALPKYVTFDEMVPVHGFDLEPIALDPLGVPGVTASNESTFFRGETKTLTLTGANLDRARLMSDDFANVKVTVKSGANTSLVANVEVTEAAALGNHTLTLSTESGAVAVPVTVAQQPAPRPRPAPGRNEPGVEGRIKSRLGNP
jgi:hypothetical protein